MGIRRIRSRVHASLPYEGDITMNELKTWVTPETEIQNFQANEYVSLCVSGQAYGNLVGQLITDYYYKNSDGTYTKIENYATRSEMDGYRIDPDCDFNSGTLYTEVYYWSNWYQEYRPSNFGFSFFKGKDDKFYVGTFTPTEGENGQGDGNGGKAWS